MCSVTGLVNDDGFLSPRVMVQSDDLRDVRLVDASQLPQPPHQLYVADPDERQLRVYALYATDFDQALLLGAVSLAWLPSPYLALSLGPLQGHLYTSPAGCHFLRWFQDDRDRRLG